jgi:NAD(P)-dependent dehydrogenase (short-subunit alcohol dehydrogenase family)
MSPLSERPVAFITGAGRGIGRGIALEMAREGYDIAGCDVVFDPKNSTSGLFEVKTESEALGAGFLAIAGDVADLGVHDAILSAVLDRFGRVDLFVSNAGVAPEVRHDVLETTPESFDKVLAVNLRGAFFLAQRVARFMIEARKTAPLFRPALVFITSISASVSSISRAEYCVSKAGLSMTARLFADRLAGEDIRVYEIRPGIIRTDMTEPVRAKYDQKIAEGLVPQGRWGYPEDVGKAVAALAKGAFSYSTGLIIEVSGGMNIPRL